MNKTTKLTSALLLGALGTTAAYAADAPLGFYVGGSAQQSRFDSDDFDVEDVDEEDTGWKLIAGYRFVPSFALEASFTDFGRAQAPSAAVGGPFVADAEALAAFGVFNAPLGPVGLFAKAGIARINGKGNVGAIFYEDKETEFAYGAGVQFHLGNLGLRAEYEKFDTDVVGDLDVISVGATYTFAFGPR